MKRASSVDEAIVVGRRDAVQEEEEDTPPVMRRLFNGRGPVMPLSTEHKGGNNVLTINRRSYCRVRLVIIIRAISSCYVLQPDERCESRVRDRLIVGEIERGQVDE